MRPLSDHDGVRLVVDCACPQLDAASCVEVRYGMLDEDDRAPGEVARPCECACHTDDHYGYGDDEPCDCDLCSAPRCGGCGRAVEREGRCTRCVAAERRERVGGEP